MCLWVSYKNKIGGRDKLDPDPDPLVRGADPDPHQNVTDPQHCYCSLLLVPFQ
jgi:hypothetical protein